MSEKSIIIIGAGLAGLSTGCYAQMNGYHSHIFEHHSAPGGVAAAWKRKDYLIDGGIHFLMGHKPGTHFHRTYRELGIIQGNRFVETNVYGRFNDEVSGRSILVTADLDCLAHDLKAISPHDARLIDELVVGTRAIQEADLSEMGLSRPAELMSWPERLQEMWNMRKVAKYLIGKYARSISEYMKKSHDPWLCKCIENLFLPEVPVWFLFLLLSWLADGQLGLIEGGCRDFVGSIEKRYKSLGGQITYKSTAEQILVENDKAVGIRLADGSEHRGDIVVSAADGYGTIFKMLSEKYLNRQIKQRYANWQVMRPIVMVSFGIAREFKGEPWMTISLLKDPFIVGNQRITGLMTRIFNYSKEFAPQGKTVVQASFETEWDWWNNLANDRPRYESEKARVADEVLKRLNSMYPGIASLVEVTDVATPYTTWRYTLNHRGAYEGWLPTPKAILTTVERTLPGLANFYMAGQWVMPGGGVAPCLYSGRHVIQMLCHKDKREFAAMVD